MVDELVKDKQKFDLHADAMGRIFLLVFVMCEPSDVYTRHSGA